MQLQFCFDVAPYLGSSLDEASTLPPVVAYLESESTVLEVLWIDVSRLYNRRKCSGVCTHRHTYMYCVTQILIYNACATVHVGGLRPRCFHLYPVVMAVSKWLVASLFWIWICAFSAEGKRKILTIVALRRQQTIL